MRLLFWTLLLLLPTALSLKAHINIVYEGWLEYEACAERHSQYMPANDAQFCCLSRRHARFLRGVVQSQEAATPRALIYLIFGTWRDQGAWLGMFLLFLTPTIVLGIGLRSGERQFLQLGFGSALVLYVGVTLMIFGPGS